MIEKIGGIVSLLPVKSGAPNCASEQPAILTNEHQMPPGFRVGKDSPDIVDLSPAAISHSASLNPALHVAVNTPLLKPPLPESSGTGSLLDVVCGNAGTDLSIDGSTARQVTKVAGGAVSPVTGAGIDRYSPRAADK